MNRDMVELRTYEFERNQDLICVLEELNGLVDGVRVAEAGEKLIHRPVFLIGCPRSGTTITMQLLSATGQYAYPSNLIARFYKNPALGYKVQQALVLLDHKRQIIPDPVGRDAVSRLGHTQGALQPSEFWYFWRQYFEFGDIQMADKPFSKEKLREFKDKLLAFEAVVGKPLLLKALILNWHLDVLLELFADVLFVFVTRDVVFNAQSLLLARENFFGDRTRWFSYKPPEFEQLKNKTPEEQVVGQVIYTNQAIEKQIRKIPKRNYAKLAYEELVEDPEILVSLLDLPESAKKKIAGIEMRDENKQKIEDEVFEQIVASASGLG